MLISIDERDARPVYVQVVSQVKEQIRHGTLKPGDELPSVRELAEVLGVNLHTVHHAYQKLREEGVIYLRLGQRARVAKPREAPAGPEVVETRLAGRLRELVTEAFHLGLSETDFRKLVDELLKAQPGGKGR